MSVDYLSKAERVERVAEDLYRRLAAKFPADGEVAKLFQQLANEERSHAQRIALLRTQAMGDRELSATIPRDTSALDTLLSEAAFIARRIDESTFTPAEASSFMLQLEKHFAVAHAEIAASRAAPSIKTFFEKLAAQDKRHTELLARLR